MWDRVFDSVAARRAALSKRLSPAIRNPAQLHAAGDSPPAARDIVLDCCMQQGGQKFNLRAAVVMPDHVHLICSPVETRRRMGFHPPRDDVGNQMKARPPDQPQAKGYRPSVAGGVFRSCAALKRQSDGPRRVCLPEPCARGTCNVGIGIQMGLEGANFWLVTAENPRPSRP